VGQKGTSGTMKVETLKIKSRAKRPMDAELSLAKGSKESKKLSLASSFVPAST
jgi:hypothetical protein